MIDLVKLAEESPEIIVAIKVSDLIAANKRLIAEAVNELAEEKAKSNEVEYLTREMVTKKLNVVPSTLWRWQKSGYLVPVVVGGQKRYRSTDIDKILNAD